MKHKITKQVSAILTVLVISLFNVSTKIHASEIYVDARSAVALDAKTKVVLFEKDAHMVIPMASTTKIMTALVTIKYGDLNKKVEISSKAASIRGSTVGYKKGEMISLKELLYGLMLRSGNDAAIAIAEGVAGSVEEFVRLMNEYAAQIGLLNTHFESPHGLDSQNHYSTAYDLAVATAKAKENRLFTEIVKSKDVDGSSEGFTRSFHNINKILWQLPNATGVKTGYTGQAGKCLVSSVDIKNNDVIIVVLNSNDRWKQTQKINNYVATHYDYKRFFSSGEVVGEIASEDGDKPIKLATNEDVIIPVKSSQNYEVKIEKPNYKFASLVKKDEPLGSISIYADGKKVFNKALQAENQVKRKGLFERLFK
jgi:D-alanyl-D-alanine carboxypeptidase